MAESHWFEFKSAKNGEQKAKKKEKTILYIIYILPIMQYIYIYIYIYISAVKRLIESKIKVFVCIIYVCVLCIFIMYI